jgi:WhiB family transcriptional regulator, redox-sensing transcriptional regulator
MIEYATEWRAASACLTADPDLFFPVAAGTAVAKQVSRALRICDGCPVRQQCLDFALRTGEKDGIWGGTTPDERIRARRARNRRPARGPWRELPEFRAS